MKILYPKNNYIVFDFETTGLNGENDHVIQMSAIKIEGGKKTAAFNRFVKTGVAIPVKIMDLTGITQQIIDTEGIAAEEAWMQFAEFIGKGLALVGHNVIAFDRLFLNTHFTRHNLPMPDRRRYIDTAMLYKAKKINEQQKYFETHFDFARRVSEIRAFGIKYKLTLCCEELGIDISGFQAHRSDSDIEMTDLIYRHFMEGENA